jgi:thioredoxin 1
MTQSSSAATVVVLCAAWCDACRTFRPEFDRLAHARRDTRFIWLDVEDEAALVGDIDVENFPTLAVFRGDVPVFFGVCLPQRAVIAKLIAAFMRDEPVRAAVPDAVAALPRLLRL